MSNRVNRKDRDNLIVIGVLVGMIVLVATFSYFTRLIPFRYVVYLLLGLEVIIFMPIICRKYYLIKSGTTPWFCYIPGLNIVQLSLHKVYVWLFCILLVVTLGLGGCIFVPYDIKASVLGEKISYMLSYGSVGYLVIVVISLSVVIGLIYISVQKDVLNMVCYLSNTSIPASEYVFMILAFVPLLRCLFLSSLNQHLTKLSMNGYKDYEEEEDYDIEEEEL